MSERKQLLEKEREEWRQKYEALLQKHTDTYLRFRDEFAKNNPLYNKLRKMQIEERLLLVQLMNFKQQIKEQQLINKQQREIKKKMFQAEIIGLAKAWVEYNNNKKMVAQIKQLEIEEAVLLEKYRDLQSAKGEIAAVYCIHKKLRKYV